MTKTIKLDVTVDDGFQFETKIAGQTFVTDYAAMDNSYLVAFLRKAAQRFVNDTLSGLEPSEKVAEAVKLYGSINAGDVMPVRIAVSRTPKDPVEARAMKDAKAYLLGVWKAQFEVKAIKDIIAADPDGKVEAYFTDDNVWIDDKVKAFIEANKAAYDFIGEAREALSGMDKIKI